LRVVNNCLFLGLCFFVITATTGVAAQEALPKLKLVTPERIAQMAAPERAEWEVYLKQSQKLAMAERAKLAEELTTAKSNVSEPAPNNSLMFEVSSRKADDAWFASDEAKQLVPIVLSYQTPSGGWSKAVDYSNGPRKPGMHWTSQKSPGWHYCGTLDNRSTTEQIRFLAACYSATKDEACRDAALAGIEWLLKAQFPSGGWPQVYPLEPGYHEAITLNDNAMVHALQLLMAVSKGAAPYTFAEQHLRQRTANAVQRGLDCLYRCQIIIDGRPTLWCAQHDPIDLKPTAARAKEPPSISGGEGAELVKFLMREADDSPEARKAIQAGIDWLSAHKITNLRKTKNEAGKTDYVTDDESTEVYWARFYDLKTQLPVFAGAQDGIVYSSFSEMAQHNKVAYDYFTTKPRDVVTKEIPRWKKRVGL
jgi:PelA/Pel-15E family pectate lyase